MNKELKERQDKVKWSCRFHPTNWWHEVGCPHKEWTNEELLDALITKKEFEEKDIMLNSTIQGVAEKLKEDETKL